jgi:NAD-dependent deacetylase
MPAMPRYENIFILTGAGISAESGIATFRDRDGLWSKYDPQEVANIKAFRRNPEKVLDFYNIRRRVVRTYEPNEAHRALARLQADHPGTVTLCTQNVDSLHEAAGSRDVIHMHGQHSKVWCMGCDDRFPWTDELTIETPCPSCGRPGAMRPDVVWFGEVPYRLEEIGAALGACDLFLSIGTSGNVYPAAGFVSRVRSIGRARTVELNLEPSGGRAAFDEAIHGPATQVVPAYVEGLLAG